MPRSVTVMSRYAQTDTCRHCRAPVLTGLDEDLCAFHATTDPNPLTALGEALALLAGRRTYELRRRGENRLGLYRRDRWQIQGRQAGDQHFVVADHQCDTPPLPTIPQPAIPAREKDTDAAIPF